MRLSSDDIAMVSCSLYNPSIILELHCEVLHYIVCNSYKKRVY